ncbi:MAG: carboxypeptidase-like regulatory domain-containing protein [Acidobacteriia bacterium]|nr:carboxypeptidase-like regulatory domain-containing protein [Terriglobia bacterium]
MKRLALIPTLALLCALALHAEDNVATLNFLVVKADNGKPIRNAAIVLHPVRKDGKQEYGGYELKTDLEGKASFAGAPFGKLRVQVLQRGFQTYGEDFDIYQPTQHITIKLKRPQPQYSIYDDKSKSGEKKPDDKPKQDAKKPDEKPK